MVDLNKFVKVNIRNHIQYQTEGTRDTVVLFTNENSSYTELDMVFDSFNQFKNYVSTDYPTSLQFAEVFFGCGGQKIRLMYKATLSLTDITDLDDQYVVVASTFSGYSDFKTLVQGDFKNLAEIHKKMFVTRVGSDSFVADTSEVDNVAVKFSDVTGAEMSIAAYLSQIDVYGIDTIHDYMFTSEPDGLKTTVTNTDYDSLIQNNYNVDIELSGRVRNCGGNAKNGYDLVNEYVRIVLHQTLTDKLVKLLATKIKSEDGIGKIYNVCCQELENYKRSGYLTTDKVWTDETYSITSNGRTYTVIEKGTPLVNGYIVRVLPATALTVEDRKQHKAPPVYIIIGDQYGIRQIDISGEII